MKELVILFAIALTFSSCFRTQSGFIKTSDGILQYDFNSRIRIRIHENREIGANRLAFEITDQMNHLERVPYFNPVTDGDASVDCEVMIDQVEVQQWESDRSREKREAEEAQYREDLRNWEIRKLTSSDSFTESRPRPPQYTKEYILFNLSYSYKGQAVISDVKDTRLIEPLEGYVIRSLVKKHTREGSWMDSGYFFFDLPLNLLTAIIQASIEIGQEEAAEKKFRGTEVAVELKNELYSKIAADVIARLDHLVMKYHLRNLYFLPVDPQSDRLFREAITQVERRPEIFRNLKEKESDWSGEKKSAYLLNRTLLAVYDNHFEDYRFYFDRALQHGYTRRQKTDYNLIIDILKDDHHLTEPGLTEKVIHPLEKLL